jgi:hypothetical protein
MERAGNTKATTATVTALHARRVQGTRPARELARGRGGGRMWINGRELGDAARFQHLAPPPG